MAAKSLSIMGASMAMGAAQSIKGAVMGYAGKQAKKGGRAAYQRLGGEKLTERLQRSRIPGISALGRGVASLTYKGGGQLVEASAKDTKGKSSDQLAMELQGFMGNEKRFAHLAELQKRGDLSSKVTTVGGGSLTEFLRDDKLFKSYGQGKLQRDVDKSLFSNNMMRQAAELADKDENAKMTVEKDKEAFDRLGDSVKALAGEAGASVKAIDLLKAAAVDFARTMGKGDIDKDYINNLYAEEEMAGMKKGVVKVLADAVSHGIATNSPSLMPAIVSKLKSTQLENFNTSYENSIRSSSMPPNIKEKRLNALEKSMLNNSLGLIPSEGTPGTTSPAATTETTTTT